MLYDDLLADEKHIQQLSQEVDNPMEDAGRKLRVLDELISRKRAKEKDQEPAPFDEGEESGEGEEDSKDFMDDKHDSAEEDQPKQPAESKPYEVDMSQPGSEGSEDQKLVKIGKADIEADEDYKSISSGDAVMEKNPPKSLADSEGLDVIKEQAGEDKEQDMSMEEDESIYLQSRESELFRASKQTDEISSKILEQFSRLIDKIKKHLADAKGSSKRDKPLTFDKINKIVFSNSGTITKRTLPASTIKMNSKSGDDGSQNLCVGLPGQTNYLIPKNCFA